MHKESTAITYEKDKDTLNYWFKEFEYDTIRFKLQIKIIKRYKVIFPKKETRNRFFKIETEKNNSIDLGSKFVLNSNIPLNSVNNNYIKIINKDSVLVQFSTKLKIITVLYLTLKYYQMITIN